MWFLTQVSLQDVETAYQLQALVILHISQAKFNHFDLILFGFSITSTWGRTWNSSFRATLY